MDELREKLSQAEKWLSACKQRTGKTALEKQEREHDMQGIMKEIERLTKRSQAAAPDDRLAYQEAVQLAIEMSNTIRLALQEACLAFDQAEADLKQAEWHFKNAICNVKNRELMDHAWDNHTGIPERWGQARYLERKKEQEEQERQDREKAKAKAEAKPEPQHKSRPNTKPRPKPKPKPTRPQPKPSQPPPRPARRAPPPAPQIPSTTQNAIDQWRLNCQKCFADYPSITTFPCPPAVKHCSEPACKNQPRALAVCECNVRAAFKLVKDLDAKKERVLWHPDKFSACAEDRREEFKVMAMEVFCVVDAVYQGR